MSRFYVPKESIEGRRIVIHGKEAHHILDVMRLKVMDKVVTFDGTGKEYSGIIREADARSLVVEITDTRMLLSDKKVSITLIQAIPKKEKMDYIIEKGTELGVDVIMPVISERTIVDWDEKKKASSVDRWKRIALEASKQCGRADIPEIGAIRKFSDAITRSGSFDLAMIAALSEGAVSLKDALADFGSGKAVIAIGPEGDFVPSEIRSAKDAGFKLINLGARVLKSDTAGLAVLAIMSYEFSS
ncbi:MAG: 16S rRNA (uracil(1498)-N(3))-methyltransferase [Candidatus Omnitrophota bacterium]|jgi:16S rRNA (uracil1498-N3)-methyltransferase